ncbi:hypothetical protein PHYSODRAFT_285047 [Phytophthora sojae]|uniref:Uncharacterized protein n=1 Tax=Phytophthora sojae (strain P6497) TaxID=1094619 RepID=G4YYN5_PHYSP|nr:hypothetical protein PHYSODRAFT_285047 [Phytophthora sojae]EGZ25153.1 hypothetical protein PHYSODRAFT_285047 [Phytophthora sojae]|eukprot:XP_009520441.1 hypothetical protein PHYSODRAFT_285047 [Phytophthora sojae]
MDMEDAMPELSLPARSHLGCRPRSEDGDVRVSHVLRSSSSEVPQHLHEQQHHMELNALRCLSLKVMLSNLSTSAPNSANANVASNKPSYAYPGVNDRAKTALLPIRQPSLQSV